MVETSVIMHALALAGAMTSEILWALILGLLLGHPVIGAARSARYAPQ
jgi:hypothetical protein